MPDLAKVFRSGNSQAVRLPKAFRFSVDQVEVTREGDAVILRPRIETQEPRAGLKAMLAEGMSDDFFADGRQQPESSEDRDFSAIFR